MSSLTTVGRAMVIKFKALQILEWLKCAVHDIISSRTSFLIQNELIFLNS